MVQFNFDATGTKPFNAPLEIADQPRDTERVWSKYQHKIFNFVEHDTGNAIVEAVAGSGKSTTIVEALKRVKGSSLFLAFNKAIADDLKKRGVNARTFHSLTYGAVTRHKRVQDVTINKLRGMCERFMTGDDYELYSSFVQRLVGLARQVGVGCLVPDSEATWMNIIDHHSLELESEFADIGRALELSRKLLDASNASNEVDFDDLLYFAVKDGLVLQKYDVVFVDEAQDTNAIQRAILRKVMHKGSRIIAVGDPAQAIYGFRGADSESMNMIAQEFNCARLPLTVSYRCSRNVIEYARQWVSHIEPAPRAPEGCVVNLGTTWNARVFAESDLVVCRTTAPLIELAYRLLRARVPVQVLGREIGAGIKGLIKKMNAQNIDHLLEKLDNWAARETEKCIAKGEDDKVAGIEDKVAAIECLVDCLSDDERTLNGLINCIDSIFTDKTNAVRLATIHKAKGLEADRVFWLDRSNCPSRWARTLWQQQQEQNLCYVAATRAKTMLVLLERIDKYSKVSDSEVEKLFAAYRDKELSDSDVKKFLEV